MNRKQYLTAVVVVLTISLGLIVTNVIFGWIQWTWVFVIAAVAYLYLRYKVSGPLQAFANKFNMLVDYDLDVQGAKQLCQERVESAPTAMTKALYMVYLGMATYYAGDYEEAIKVFNQIELKKLNSIRARQINDHTIKNISLSAFLYFIKKNNSIVKNIIGITFFFKIVFKSIILLSNYPTYHIKT